MKLKSLFKKLPIFLLTIACLTLFTACDILGMLGLGHKHKYTDTVISPTCTAQGYTKHVCSCGDEKTDTFVSPLGHSYNSYVSNGDGTKTSPCVRSCGSFDTKPESAISGEISFHFLMLGNEYAGDCIYVKAGDNDILIDAGSRTSSISTIDDYIDDYITDGTIEYVIATHADQDHIAGFSKKSGSIFDLYECEIIIDFPLTDKTTATYNNYVDERDDEVSAGAKHYTALDCYNNLNGAQRVYDLTSDGSIKMEILYNYYYENDSSDENNYSVCVQFTHGDRKFLFTGDLEAEGEEYLVQNNDLTQVELYKAGHHGSKTSSNDCLLDVISPKICVVSCCAGSVEYTQNFANTFPTQDFINRISKHTDKVYVPVMIDTVYNNSKDKYENVENETLLNGNIVVRSHAQSGVTVTCSNNDTLLKDTDWFIANRTTPQGWLD